MRKPCDGQETRMTTTVGLGNFMLGTILETDRLKAFLTESLGQLVNCGRFPVFIMLLDLIIIISHTYFNKLIVIFLLGIGWVRVLFCFGWK